ncbi:MAG: Gfo/Idh/MocA family oxidoreductase [Bacteroidetes bacterium]|nr:Gfo/Idh/MocA family oxidoreductase [Bacteroidota bacterium]
MIKIGVIGVGKLGKLHATILKESTNFELVGCFDNDPIALKNVCESLDIMPYTSALSLIKDCDAIDIVTNASSHYEYTVAALKNGKHVFIEKPFTQTLQEAQHLVQLSHEADVKIQVGYIERFNPAYKNIENINPQPLFIESHRLSTFDPRGTDTSVVLDLMVHDLDIILQLVKANVKNIQANGVSVISDNIDIANARIEFDNGCVVNITASRISMKKMRKMRIFQKDAYISMDFLDKKTEIIKIVDDEIETGLALHINGKTKNIVVKQPKTEPSNALLEELESFGNSIKLNKKTVVNAEDALKSMELAFEILKKIKRNSFEN